MIRMQGALGMLTPAAVESCCWKIKHQRNTVNVMFLIHIPTSLNSHKQLNKVLWRTPSATQLTRTEFTPELWGVGTEAGSDSQAVGVERATPLPVCWFWWCVNKDTRCRICGRDELSTSFS